MNKFNKYAFSMASIALVLVTVLAISMTGAKFALAAPSEQEIPAATANRNSPSGATLFYGIVTTATAASSYGNTFDVTPYDTGELNLVVDQTIVAAAANTVTVVLQYSADRVNWTNAGAGAVVTASVADANSWVTPVVIGRYARVKVTPSNALPVTITVAGVLEP